MYTKIQKNFGFIYKYMQKLCINIWIYAEKVLYRCISLYNKPHKLIYRKRTEQIRTERKFDIVYIIFKYLYKIIEAKSKVKRPRP